MTGSINYECKYCKKALEQASFLKALILRLYVGFIKCLFMFFQLSFIVYRFISNNY